MSKKFSIPSKISFSEEIMNVSNPNFHPVKLRIMSSGENYNFSDIKKEGFENAQYTVGYSPILANVIEREDGELDANGHDIDYEMKVDYNGNLTVKEEYIERPVGVFINNATKIVPEDDKVYLESYGYIWKCYSDIYEILKRDETKDVSVEIEVTEGHFRDDGYYQIENFIILGCTILGQTISPAIEKSSIQFNFSKDDNKEYFDNLETLKSLLNQQFAKEGINNMDNENINVGNQEEFENDNQETKDDEVCPVCGENPCVCDDKPNEDDENFKKKRKCEKIYSQEELDEAVANAKAEFANDMAELETLRTFKAEYDKQLEMAKLENDVNEVVSKFSFKDEDISEIKEKAMNKEISLEQLELSLFRMSYNKKDFSKKEEQPKQVKLKINNSELEHNPVDDLFGKYGL